MWPAVGAAVAGVANLIGQERANKTNIKEAQKTRDFSERMRNTQWQSAVEDMQKAGINPALAYQQGPNAAPGGQAQVASSSTEGVSSALQAIITRKNIQQLEAGIKKTRAETRGVDIRNAAEAARLAESRARGAVGSIVERGVTTARQGLEQEIPRAARIWQYELDRVAPGLLDRARAALGSGVSSARQGIQSARDTIEQSLRDALSRPGALEVPELPRRWGGTFGEAYRARMRRERMRQRNRNRR